MRDLNLSGKTKYYIYLNNYSLLRQYLADNVVPFLTEGLIELCKSHPEDPVDTLVIK